MLYLHTYHDIHKLSEVVQTKRPLPHLPELVPSTPDIETDTLPSPREHESCACAVHISSVTADSGAGTHDKYSTVA